MAKTRTSKKTQKKDYEFSSTFNLVKADAVIEGLAPGLLFQGKGLMIADTNVSKGKPRSATEEARLRAHWIKNGKKDVLCIPWIMFFRSFVQAAAGFKHPKQRRKTMSSFIGSTLSCEVDKISLGKSTFKTYEEFCRIPPRTGAMVNIGRPLIYPWSVTIPLIIDATDYPVEVLPTIISDAGRSVGIGAWRPGLKGPYGKYVLKSFSIKED